MGRTCTPGAVCLATRRPVLRWLGLAGVLRLAAHAAEAAGVTGAALSAGGSNAESAGVPVAALSAGGSAAEAAGVPGAILSAGVSGWLTLPCGWCGCGE